MIVKNSQHETAIVIRRDGQTVVFIPFRTGKLACKHLTESLFREEWQEVPCSLQDTLDRFIAHGQANGCTLDAFKGLQKLKVREDKAISSLF